MSRLLSRLLVTSSPCGRYYPRGSDDGSVYCPELGIVATQRHRNGRIDMATRWSMQFFHSEAMFFLTALALGRSQRRSELSDIIFQPYRIASFDS